jgi:ABC-type glutathione transport system ATPase component
LGEVLQADHDLKALPAGLGDERGEIVDRGDVRDLVQQPQQRVKRLLAAQAALRREPVPRKHQRRLARQDIRDYLAKHPGSLAVEIAEALGVPPTNVGTHLSNGKKDEEFDKHRNRWSLTQHAGGAIATQGDP